MDIAKWSYSLGNIILEDCMFRSICENDILESAKWLYSLDNDKNIFDIDEAFMGSCEFGCIDVTPWLYSIGANIRTGDDFAFTWCCHRGDIETAKWLCEICPDYKMEIVDNKINKCWVHDMPFILK